MGRADAWAGGSVRQIARTLAVFLTALALILQANAPVQAALMAAGSDLPGDLCAIHTPAGHGSGQDQPSPTDREKSCAACAVCVAAAGTAVLASAGVVPAPVSVAFVRRSVLVPRFPGASPVRAANARAPPFVL